MTTVSRRFALSLAFLACLGLVGCGAGDEQDSSADDAEFMANSEFDESQLPADFPTNLIPPNYDGATYTQLGPVETASFESSRPVREAIEHYTGLLGEPTLDTGDADGDGEIIVQWNMTPWAVSVLGGDDETMVGFTRVPE